MGANNLLSVAIDETNELIEGEVFLVRDLFKGYVWNRIEKSDRLRLGILFLNQVKSTEGIGIEVLDKTSANQQKYRKLQTTSLSLL